MNNYIHKFFTHRVSKKASLTIYENNLNGTKTNENNLVPAQLLISEGDHALAYNEKYA